MKLPLKAIVPLLAVVALTAACNPVGASSRERLPEDPRFAEFTFDSVRGTGYHKSHMDYSYK